ncbi:penicillin acylase family protein [Aerolutibacter ruishenii]|uniref:Penicillin amidase n=1 Tax=Aerolutibacter ruishenii TaxID=686800 RepID=A0A562LSG0_9GAMM|nr:penicillin acylase family protein [Lysobacter ruishenii]TWI10571.1 penicillin amidase [Lysobacter ruishenii]
MKWIRRGFVLIVGVAAVAALLGWWLLRGSLPQLDGQLATPGLSAPVTVQRDELGIVTVDAVSEADAMRALGYVHAQERYFEMDLMRRTAAGELAGLFGERAVELDKSRRVHRIRARVTRDLARIAGDKRAVLDAYVEGVNAGLAALRTRPWPYLLLRTRPEPWRAEDSALTGFAMYFDLHDPGNARELALWRLQPRLPAPLFNLLAYDGSQWDAPIAGRARGDAPLPSATELDLRTLAGARSASTRRLDDIAATGSNNFAVAGALTRDGRAIVADDMHLGLRAPNIWFRARLRYADAMAAGGRVDVTGFTLPGLPTVVVGSNGHVAWGFTNGYGDWLDWRRERPCPTRNVSTGCEPTVRHDEPIAVAGGRPEPFTVEESAWGPILHREPDGTALALRWTAHLPGALNFGLSHFARAGSLDQALAFADTAAVPGQNLVIGDRTGRIAWRMLGPMPLRGAGCSIHHLVEEGDACRPWPVSTAGAPAVIDPPAGRLWTANSRVVDGHALDRIGDGGYVLGTRARQIRDALFTHEQFDERTLLAIQLDDRAGLLTPWWHLLRDSAARTRRPALTALATAAKHWEGRAAADAVSYRLVRTWRLAVNRRIEAGLLAPARAALGDNAALPSLPQLEGVAWPMVTARPAHLLPTGYASWDALLEDAAIETRDALMRQGPLEQRTWGEQNTANICHPLAGALPAFAKPWLCMPFEPLPGDTAVPRVQTPDKGASQRMVVAPGHEAEGIAHMPGGQSGHPLSPFWGAGHDDWVHGRPTPFLPGAARHTLRMVPTQR